jgi:hypothetical protein
VRKLLLALFAVVLIAGMTFYFGIIRNHKNLDDIEELTERYLIQRGYSINEFHVEAEYYWESKMLGYNPYVIRVRFNDEDNALYFYKYKANHNIVMPDGAAPMNGKNDKYFKHLLDE